MRTLITLLVLSCTCIACNRNEEKDETIPAASNIEINTTEDSDEILEEDSIAAEIRDIKSIRLQQIEELRISLPLTKTVEYALGDGENYITHYKSDTGNQFRLLAESDRGSYGSGEKEYFKINEHLICVRELSHDWDHDNEYGLFSRFYYFSDDSTGVMEYQSIVIHSEHFDQADLDSLNSAPLQVSEASVADYERLFKDLEYDIVRKAEPEESY